MDTLPPHAQNGKPSPHVPTTPGIYKITCTANNKIYIGSAVNLRKRMFRHFRDLRQNEHDNLPMQRAWRKYGEDAFTFEVLEFVLVPEMLTAREQYWFDKLKPFEKRGFNLSREAGSRLGVKHTPEAIEKMRQSKVGKKHTPEARAKMGLVHIGNKYRLGRKATPETLERLRQSHAGKPSAFKGKHHTAELREKLRQARRRQQITPETIEKRRQSNTGKKRTPEQNEANRQSKLAYYAKQREAGEIHPNQGKKRTPEQVEKFKQAQQKSRSEKKSTSSTGFRGISVYQKKRNNRIESTTYKFSCQSKDCKITKYFPYTEEGLEAARIFAEAHYAAMKKE